jgi:hypothetical protein
MLRIGRVQASRLHANDGRAKPACAEDDASTPARTEPIDHHPQTGKPPSHSATPDF